VPPTNLLLRLTHILIVVDCHVFLVCDYHACILQETAHVSTKAGLLKGEVSTAGSGRTVDGTTFAATAGGADAVKQKTTQEPNDFAPMMLREQSYNQPDIDEDHVMKCLADAAQTDSNLVIAVFDYGKHLDL
jgi:hypothetical protein